MIKEVIEFIDMLPKYESHHARAAMTDRNYLTTGLNLTIIDNDYKKWSDEKNGKSISKYMFIDIFQRKFNLKFKQPAQDTCDFCNKMKFKISGAALKSNERLNFIEERVAHWECVELIQREYKEHVSKSKMSTDSKIVLVFDLRITVLICTFGMKLLLLAVRLKSPVV